MQAPDERVINPPVEDRKRTKKEENAQQSDNSASAKVSKIDGKGTRNTDDSTRVAADHQAINTENKQVESRDESLSAATKGTSKSKHVKETKPSENGSGANADSRKSGQDEIKLSQVHAVSKPKQTAGVSETANQHGNDENIGANSLQPRNKRAERLAKQATESNPVVDNRDASSVTIQSLALSHAAAKTESSSDKSSLPVATEPHNSSPITSISSVIIPSAAINTGAPNTTTSQIARPIGDGISAIATSSLRGGIQTNNSNTTIAGSISNPARAEQAKAEAARSNAGPHITAYQETKLVQRVLRGVEQLANGGGQVRLRLHPPELGSLQMSLRMEAGQVFAKLEVENTTARDALLNNVQTLKDRMAEQGMKVAAFEVEVSTDSSGLGTGGSNLQNGGGSGSESRWKDASSRFAQQNSNRISSEPEPPERKSGAVWTRTNGSLDLTV